MIKSGNQAAERKAKYAVVFPIPYPHPLTVSGWTMWRDLRQSGQRQLRTSQNARSGHLRVGLLELR